MKNKKLLTVIISVVMSCLLSISAFAVDSKAQIPEYPVFDINDYIEYRPVLEQYGIDEDEVIAIMPIPSTDMPSQTRGEIPGGILVVVGTWTSPVRWQMTVLNIGVVDVTNMEADVILISNTYGVVFNRPRVLGGLDKHGSLHETFNSVNGLSADLAIVTITGKTAEGEYFNMGGVDYR